MIILSYLSDCFNIIYSSVIINLAFFDKMQSMQILCMPGNKFHTIIILFGN